ncbi:MAG: urease accessory UreF family protein [Verrucomicrobiales bacterium]
MDGGIYIRDRHDGEELRRAIRIATFRVDFSQPATLSTASAESFEADWSDWLDGRWNPFLAGHLVEAYLKSRLLELDEVMRLDHALNEFLDPEEAQRSLAAGRMLSDAAQGVRHHRALERFCEIRDREGESGHAATVFGIEAGAFSLPLFSTLVSYLFFEWKSARRALPGGTLELSEARFTLDAMGALGGIRELLKEHLGNFLPADCA